jgi:hypothetical protein
MARDVVVMLEAAEQSLTQRGIEIPLRSGSLTGAA